MNIGILFLKLFWPSYCNNNFSNDWEKPLKFEAEGWEFVKILWLLEQFIQTVKGQIFFETECFFYLSLEVFQIFYIRRTQIQIGKKIWTQKPKEKVRKCIKYVSETPEKHLIDQFSLSRQIVNGINVLNYPSKSLHLSALDIRIPPNSSLSLKAQNSLDFWIHPTTCQEMIIVFKYVCHLNTIPMIRSGL